MVEFDNKTLKKNCSAQQGFLTLEMMLALAMIVMGIASVLLLVFGSQASTLSAQDNQDAIYKAQRMLEDARATARADFSSLVSQSPVTDGIYTKTLTVTPDADGYTKTVNALVTWAGGLKISLSTKVTDWSATIGVCNPALSGDWTNPDSYAFQTQNLLPGNSSNGLGISDLKAYKHKLYVTATYPANAGDTFYIFDLPINPASPPTYVNSIDNDTASATGPKALTLGTSGSKLYAFMANPNVSKGQLQILEVTNPGSITNGSVVSYKTGMPSGLGNAIAYSNGYVYLGLTAASGSGKEFNVIDVHNPLAPIWKGGYSTGGKDVRSIFVKGNYAYIATSGSENLTVVNISDPVNPVRAGGFTPGTSNTGRSVYGFGSNIFLGRTTGTNEFYMLDASNPANLSVLGSKDIGSGSTTNVISVVVRQYLAFLVTDDQLQIWNINTPSNITSYATVPFQGIVGNGNGTPSGTGLSCSSNYFYISLASSQGNNKDLVAIITPHVNSSYTLSNSGSLSVAQGGSGTETITRTLVSGFPPGETLTVAGLPAGANSTWNNNPCTPTCASQLSITTQYPATPVGTYPITVTAPSGVSTTFNLVVTPTQQFTFSVTAPNVTMAKRASVTQTVTVTKLTGTAAPVTVTITPPANTVTVTPASQTCTPSGGTCTVTFTLTAGNNPVNNKTVPILGTSPGAPNANGSFILNVQ